MRILSPEQAYFALEDRNAEEQAADAAFDAISRAQARTLREIIKLLVQLRDEIDAHCDEVSGGPEPTPEDWQEILNMADTLVYELHYHQISAIKEVAGI